MILKILLGIFIGLKCTQSANILGIFPMPGVSHYILAYKLMKGLAEAGHNVTMISPYKLKDPPKNGKYTDVVLDGFKEDFDPHPNVKLFITHGGLLSTTETIHHGVPILAIPVFGDQPSNAARATASGFGVFPMTGISHHILAYRLMKGLAEAGHDVTMISPYKLKDIPKNGSYTDIVLDGFKEEVEQKLHGFNLYDFEKMSISDTIQIMTDIFMGPTNKTFYHPNVQKLLKSNKKFDAVIMEQFFNDAHKVFSHIYGCPLIMLSSIGPNPQINPTVGNPQPVSYIPHMFLSDFRRDDFSVLFRTKNLFCYVLHYFLTYFYLIPKQDKFMREAVPGAPPLYDLYTNVSLVLLNSHTSMYNAVPVVPNMVEIGGYFIDPPQKLPQDLQEFLDSAKDGAIYFSMGSNLKSKDLPENKKKIILNVLGKLKQKVLWKFEEDLPGKPSNIMIRKWLPQQDILAHPNIKLFITHGGLLSTTETIYHGVPIFAIPVFGDQNANAAKATASGIGQYLAYHDPEFTEERFGDLLNEVLNNPKYRENAQLRSKLYQDRPQKPMETAVYWVEYIIRHKGASHLRVAGIRMPWYKYFMVDVISVLILGILITFYSAKLLLKKLCCRSSKSKRSFHKQKTN